MSPHGAKVILITFIKERQLMEQNKNLMPAIELSGWFEIDGDVDDFIFYSETPKISEK